MKYSSINVLLLALLVTASTTVTAHVEYYDLNQGRQISDLTAVGKKASTQQYGSNPAIKALPRLKTISDRPLNDKRWWSTINQVYTGVGRFSSVRYTPTSSSATVRVFDVTDWGWGDGTHATLGDSHKVDFFNFRLSKTSTVTISWNVSDGNGNFVDCGFSLYAGVLSYQAHDDASEPLNPKRGAPPQNIEDPLDSGRIKDAQGIASALRNTRTNVLPYVGQFNARGSWGQGNPAGNWSNVRFIKAVNARNPVAGFSISANDTLEQLTITLRPGNYTIAASGALGARGFGAADSFGVSSLQGVLVFRAKAQ